MKRLLSLLILSIMMVASIAPFHAQSQEDDTCDDYENELAFTERHPDDGSYIGQFAGIDNDFSRLTLPLYAESSPFNQPIPDDAAVDSRSEEKIEHLASEAVNGIVVSIRAWTVSAYVTDENTPRHDVMLIACWSPFGRILNVPIPDGALPDPVGDGHMSILALDEGYEYDFWQIEQLDDGTWQAAWGNRIPLDGDGIYPNGMGARGSGFGLLAGVIFPEELDTGEINHALVVSLPAPAEGGPVLPATESDGYSDQPLAIPEGARLQLDPTLDLDTLGLSGAERTFVEALQTYGAFVGDVGGEDLGFYIVNANSFVEWRYGDHFGEPDFDMMETGAIAIDSISIQDFRVLEYPSQIAEPEIDVMDMGIFADPRY